MNHLRPLGCLLVMIVTTFGHSAEPARPNIVFIVADDLNTHLGCYGSTVVKSPNIDRLAARGVRFEHAYCQYPVCNASRTSFLSGRRPDSTGIVDNVTPPRTFLKDAAFLPEHFRKNGYATIKVGKIFHTGNEFEDARSWDIDVRETNESKTPPNKQIVRRAAGIVLNADDADTWDGKVARQSVTFLEKAVADAKPFFLAVGFRRPHSPYIAPQKYFDLYPPSQMQPRLEPAEHLQNIPPLALTYKTGGNALKPNQRAETMSAYYASLSFMDAQVGFVLDAIDRLKIADRTIIIFISDHGYHLGEHGGLWHKMTLFEQGTRVPLIIAAPGRKSNVVCSKLAELVDLYPTLTALCGLAAPEGLEGTSLAPLLDDPSRSWKKGVLTVVSRVGDTPATKKLDIARLGRTIRTERFRYTQWPDGQAELYDYQQDPLEYSNLIKEPTLAATVSLLGQMIKDGWKACLPDK